MSVRASCFFIVVCGFLWSAASETRGSEGNSGEENILDLDEVEYRVLEFGESGWDIIGKPSQIEVCKQKLDSVKPDAKDGYMGINHIIPYSESHSGLRGLIAMAPFDHESRIYLRKRKLNYPDVAAQRLALREQSRYARQMLKRLHSESEHVAVMQDEWETLIKDALQSPHDNLRSDALGQASSFLESPLITRDAQIRVVEAICKSSLPARKEVSNTTTALQLMYQIADVDCAALGLVTLKQTDFFYRPKPEFTHRFDAKNLESLIKAKNAWDPAQVKDKALYDHLTKLIAIVEKRLADEKALRELQEKIGDPFAPANHK